MSPYVFSGLLLTFVAWSGFMYYEGHSNEATQCKANDSQATVAAYEHKDAVTAQQTTIQQTEVKTYEKDSHTIGAMYLDSVPPPSSNLPVISRTTERICPSRSRKYKLDFKQCDVEEAKLKRLFDRDKKLSAIK